jgi:hypothetical protein
MLMCVFITNNLLAETANFGRCICQILVAYNAIQTIDNEVSFLIISIISIAGTASRRKSSRLKANDIIYRSSQKL